MGIHMIGYLVMSFGLFNSIGCLLLIPLIKLRGRMVIFFIGSVISLLGIILMFVWTHYSHFTSLLFIIPMFWGLADSIMQSQTKGWLVRLVTKIFKQIVWYCSLGSE